MNAFQNVIAHPSSISARHQLAQEWERAGRLQGALLGKVLALKARELPLREIDSVRDEIRELIEDHGREWAGFLVNCTEAYYYELGMIGNVVLTGEQFVEHGARICDSFTILHLGLREPMCLEQVFAMPQLKHISTLFLAGDSGDHEAALMAACPYLTNLRIGALGDRITAVGMQALATAPSLTNVIALDITNNPGAHSSVRGHLFTKQINDSVYLLGPAAVPLYNDALDHAAKGYNCETPDWPPSYVDVAWTE